MGTLTGTIASITGNEREAEAVESCCYICVEPPERFVLVRNLKILSILKSQHLLQSVDIQGIVKRIKDISQLKQVFKPVAMPIILEQELDSGFAN